MATMVGICDQLLAYKPKQKYTALCWRINVSKTTSLDDLSFEVQVDVVDTFNSVNLKTYTESTCPSFQDGLFYKSMVFPDQMLFKEQAYYFRVRVAGDVYTSCWSDVEEIDDIETYLTGLTYNTEFKILVDEDNEEYITVIKNYAENYIVDGTEYEYDNFITYLADTYDIEDSFYVYIGAYKFTVDAVSWYDDTEASLNQLPDSYVYTKTGNTNIRKVIELYMRLIAEFKAEAKQVLNNYNYSKIQDEDLYDRLGILLSFTRNEEEPLISYKYELLALWEAFLYQGTLKAFNIVIKALYGTEADIDILKNIRDVWRVYENVSLISIDGSTSTITDFDTGDTIYDPNQNLIITAQADNDWTSAIVQEPDTTATYQLLADDGTEQEYYHYDGVSMLVEDRPSDITRYYVRERYYDEDDDTYYFSARKGSLPYTYTTKYLSHNIVINIPNPFGVEIDQTVLLAILNNLKPINMNFVLNIKNYSSYNWGDLFSWGQRGLYWGGYDTTKVSEDEESSSPAEDTDSTDTDVTLEIINTQGATVTINGTEQDQLRVSYGTTVTWSVSLSGYTTQSGSVTMYKATVLVIKLTKSTS